MNMAAPNTANTVPGAAPLTAIFTACPNDAATWLSFLS